MSSLHTPAPLHGQNIGAWLALCRSEQPDFCYSTVYFSRVLMRKASDRGTDCYEMLSVTRLYVHSHRLKIDYCVSLVDSR
jgi:hypothetical protein